MVLVIEHTRHVLITVIDCHAEPPFISTEMMIFIIQATVFVLDQVYKHEVKSCFIVKESMVLKSEILFQICPFYVLPQNVITINWNYVLLSQGKMESVLG